jgi:hypothetical protein
MVVVFLESMPLLLPLLTYLLPVLVPVVVALWEKHSQTRRELQAKEAELATCKQMWRLVFIFAVVLGIALLLSRYPISRSLPAA